jgi:hypothetical protein
MKIEIEIPDPPEGWQLDGYRVARPNEKWWTGSSWVCLTCGSTVYAYPVAIKSNPLWTPSPELVAVLNPGWIARDESGRIALHQRQPTCRVNYWYSTALVESVGDSVNPEFLPPITIPWDKCCFRIGGDE